MVLAGIPRLRSVRRCARPSMPMPMTEHERLAPWTSTSRSGGNAMSPRAESGAVHDSAALYMRGDVLALLDIPTRSTSAGRRFIRDIMKKTDKKRLMLQRDAVRMLAELSTNVLQHVAGGGSTEKTTPAGGCASTGQTTI